MAHAPELADPRPAPSSGAPPADADGSASGLLRAAVESATVLQESEDFEAGILRALEIVGRATGAECARLVEFHFRGDPPALASWTPLQQWTRTPEFARRMAHKPPLTFAEAPVWAGRILAGEAVLKGCAESAPDPAMRRSLRELGVTGVLMVTVTVEGRPWGGLNLFGQAGQRAWTAMERDALVCAVKAFGFAVHRRRILLREREAEARRLREHAAALARHNGALQAMIDTLGGLSHPGEVVPAALRIAADSFGADNCAFYEHAEGDLIRLRWWARGGRVMHGEALADIQDERLGPFAPLVQGFTAPDDYLGTPARQRTRATVLDHASGTSVPAFDRACMQNGWSFEINAPVVINGAADGALVAYRATPFTADEVELAEALARQMGLALQAGRLARTASQAVLAREREEAARVRAAELAGANRALSGSLARLGEARDPAEVLSHVLLTLTTELNTPSSTLWLYDMERRECVLHLVCEGGRVVAGSQSGHPNATRPARMDLDTVAHQATTVGRQPFLTSLDDDTLDEDQRAYLRGLGVHALLGLPMVSGDEVLGLITTRFVQAQEVTRFQVELAQSLAIQATLALQMSRLAEQARRGAVLEERNRIAREIHDTLAQGFTGIIWGLEGARQSVDEASRAPVDTALGLARTSLAEARRSLWALRPAQLSSDGLEPMLRRLVEQQPGTGAPVRLRVDGAPPRLEPDVEMNLVRLAQEAVSNAVRHAGASSILVLLRADADALSIAVEDDGRGFEPDAPPGSASYGLRGMRERAARAGAHLAIDSRPGAGTRITVRVPLPAS